MIGISEESLKRVERILASVPGGAEKALAGAMNRGLSRIRTESKRQVREVYAVQSSVFSSAANIRLGKANTGNLSGYVSFSGYKIPLYKFRVTSDSAGKHVRAVVKKGGDTEFRHAFVAHMRNGHTGIFERKTSERFPIEEKMGLAAAQMVKNEKIVSAVEKDAQELVSKRLEHEIERILNGYGR